MPISVSLWSGAMFTDGLTYLHAAGKFRAVALPATDSGRPGGAGGSTAVEGPAAALEGQHVIADEAAVAVACLSGFCIHWPKLHQQSSPR